MRRRGIEPREHALDLFQLLHQVRLGVQPARGVRNQYVDLTRARGLQPVENHRSRLGAVLLRDDRYTVALGPGLQLFAGRSAKGIAGDEHDLQSLGHQPVGELSDRRRLARAVDADHQNHIGSDQRIDAQRLLHRPQDRLH